MKLFILFIIAVMATSCSPLSKQDNNGLDNEIGWLHGRCLAIKNADIPPQYQIKLVHLDDEVTFEKAIVLKKTTESEECYPLMDDRASVNKNAGYFFYIIKSERPVNLAIGLLNPEELSISGLKFSYCTTTEGVQFSISKNSSVIWQGYYYLGYESEPTCTSE
ncbi:hypothetical protein [Desulfobacter curvatus]|uniref:hypothetical protein n=1 Tax=Desulfobacter curvatus TaxID=2290 RepID=UPI00036BEF3A|nr:hypothetical protein [Desulfobacter curvatus]